MSRQKPLDIEIIAHVAGSMAHCTHCQVFIDGTGVGEQVHKQNIESYPPDIVAEWQKLSDWILELAETYAGELIIRVTDAQTVRGLWTALTKRVRRYPTFILEGQERFTGWDKEQLNHLIQQHLAKATG